MASQKLYQLLKKTKKTTQPPVCYYYSTVPKIPISTHLHPIQYKGLFKDSVTCLKKLKPTAQTRNQHQIITNGVTEFSAT